MERQAELSRSALSSSIVARLDYRKAVLIALGLVLVALALTGTFTASSQNTIDGDEAIEIARREIDWEPATEGARFVRQGVAMRPIWAVSFSNPGGARRSDFERLTTVEIDAETAEVLRISIDDGE